MKLILKAIPSALGIYGPNRDTLPARMRYLHPEAAAAFAPLADKLRVSDMFRSAESSLLARRQKRGVQRPGYSAHNYGLAVDLDVADCLRRLKLSKQGLDELLAEHGWYCHRKDHRLDFEAWHYNYLGVGTEAARYLAVPGSTTAPAIEAKLQALYGASWRLSTREVQEALAQLRLYRGEVDGLAGPLTEEAVRAFQRAWELDVDGKAGPKTCRTLALVAAEREEG